MKRAKDMNEKGIHAKNVFCVNCKLYHDDVN